MNTIRKIWEILAHDEKPVSHLLCSIVLSLPLDVGELFRLKIKIQDYYIHFRRSALATTFWRNPNDRISDYMFITSYLKENDVYIDVGANIGTTLIPAAKCVKGGTAIGFEPHPRIFKYLKENISLNSLENGVELYNCALGNERGYVEFSSNRNDDTNRVLRTGKGIKVPVKLLDDVGEVYSKVDLVKIDVEGYEIFVIAGGVKTLKKTQCIYIEVAEDHFNSYRYSVKDLLSALGEMGFSLFIKKDLGILQPVNSENKSCVDHTNLLAIRNTEDFARRTGWQIRHDAVD
jgi:FkbM family methyltransferase